MKIRLPILNYNYQALGGDTTMKSEHLKGVDKP